MSASHPQEPPPLPPPSREAPPGIFVSGPFEFRISPRVLYLLILDPMRSSSYYHWCPWIRACKLSGAVRRKTHNLRELTFVLCFQVLYNISSGLAPQESGTCETILSPFPFTDLSNPVRAASTEHHLSLSLETNKSLRADLRWLYLLILDPMRSSSSFHWCPWIRACKLSGAVRRKHKTS